MKVTITEPVKQEVPKGSFVVEYETMRGDADGYSYNTVGPFRKGEHEEHLASILQVFKGISEKYPLGSRRLYGNIPGFYSWFADDIPNVEEYRSDFRVKNLNHTEDELRTGEKALALAIDAEICGEWPTDLPIDYGIPEALCEYHVFYYDENGVKHHVEIEWDF